MPGKQRTMEQGHSDGLMKRVAVLAISLQVAACSSNPFKSGPSDFDVTFISAAETWDLNKDTIVTCDEWREYAGTSLRQSDGDGDGALAAEEFASMAQGDKLFTLANLAYYDQNSDGRVSSDELTGKRNRAFELLDKNSDCKIERDEKVTVRYEVKEKPDEKHLDPNASRKPGY